jgi:hypothetical protein
VWIDADVDVICGTAPRDAFAFDTPTGARNDPAPCPPTPAAAAPAVVLDADLPAATRARRVARHLAGEPVDVPLDRAQVAAAIAKSLQE